MHPVLFYFGDVPVDSYRFFNTLAVVVGAILYFRLTRSDKMSLEKRVLLWTGALTGGFIGAKLADVVLNYKYVLSNLESYINQLVGSRTVLGGIIGGYFGVNLVKKLLGIREKTGDPFALATVLAMGIGRIGCFLGGCCYGKPASGWFAVYMAGEYRYPTQLLEMSFDFILFGVLWTLKNKMRYPGDLFKLFVFSYAFFRFFIEFIRAEPVIWRGLTVYQLMAIPLIVLGGLYFIKRYFLHEKGV